MFQRPAKNKENKGLSFQSVFSGASTGYLMHNLYGYLRPIDRAKLAITCKDAYQFEKVDRALTQVEFKIKLMEDILRVLNRKEYESKLKVCRNPSGFLRLSDVIKELDPTLLAELPKACNVRLNFWPGQAHTDLGATFSLETRHSHPRRFCSFIVSGGYEHYLYLATKNPSDSPFEVVKITIAEDGKTFSLQDKPEYLSAPIKEKVIASSDGYAYFSTSLLHEVVARMPAGIESVDEGTLSINIVFKEDGKTHPKYNLYFPKYDKDNVVEKYDELPQSQADKTLEVVRNILSEKIENLKALSLESEPESNIRYT